jgi:hypothetical protein
MRIPYETLEKVENAASRLKHGIVTLKIHIRDGHPRCNWGFEEWVNDSDEQPSINDFAAKDEMKQRNPKIVTRKPGKPGVILRYYIPYAV